MVEVRIAANSTYYSYEALKQVAMAETLSFVQIEQLKNIFQNEISSIRRQECIRNLTDLINVLEKRDALSETNIQAFHKIAIQCNLPALQIAIKSYSLPNQNDLPSIFHNEYRERRLAETLRQNLNLQISRSGNISGVGAINLPTDQVESVSPASTTSNHTSPLTEEKRKAIFKKLSKELGSYWRNFGRELNVGEGDMDNIELQFPRDIPSRIYKLLQVFEEDDCHDPKKNILLICRALDGCRRKDLRRAVEDILSH